MLLLEAIKKWKIYSTLYIFQQQQLQAKVFITVRFTAINFSCD